MFPLFRLVPHWTLHRPCKSTCLSVRWQTTWTHLVDLALFSAPRTRAGSPGHYSDVLRNTPVHSEHPAGERVQCAIQAVLNRVDATTIIVAVLFPRTQSPLRSSMFTCVLGHRCHIRTEGTEITRYCRQGVLAAGYRR